jgi:hypothetical protein
MLNSPCLGKHVLFISYVFNVNRITPDSTEYWHVNWTVLFEIRLFIIHFYLLETLSGRWYSSISSRNWTWEVFVLLIHPLLELNCFFFMEWVLSNEKVYKTLGYFLSLSLLRWAGVLLCSRRQKMWNVKMLLGSLQIQSLLWDQCLWLCALILCLSYVLGGCSVTDWLTTVHNWYYYDLQ